MPRPIRRPYDPTKPVHDRRATDLTRLAEVAAIEIDDPMGLELGDKIVTLRQLRGDPLAAMHNKKLINDALYYGGRAYQGDFEKAEQGPQAIDPSKEYVDGGKPPDPLPEGRGKAVDRLKAADEHLADSQGKAGIALLRDFLIAGMSMEQICAARLDFSGTRDRLYIGRRIRECLNDLAVIYGFATTGGRI